MPNLSSGVYSGNGNAGSHRVRSRDTSKVTDHPKRMSTLQPLRERKDYVNGRGNDANPGKKVASSNSLDVPLTAKEHQNMEMYAKYCSVMSESAEQLEDAIKMLGIQKEAALQRSNEHFEKLLENVRQNENRCAKQLTEKFQLLEMKLNLKLMSIRRDQKEMDEKNSIINNILKISSHTDRLEKLIDATHAALASSAPKLIKPPNLEIKFNPMSTKKNTRLFWVKGTEPCINKISLATSEQESRSPVVKEWIEMSARMRTARCDLATVMSPDGRQLVAVGGDSGGSNPLCTAEFFDFYTQKWNRLSDHMRMKRSALGAAMSPDGKKLYAVGGVANGTPSSSVEYFDFSTQMWKMLPAQMKSARHGLGVTISADGRRLFAVGGYVKGKPVNSAEFYDFKTKQWYDLPPMKHCRAGLGLTVSPNGRHVYAIGGSSEAENRKGLRSMEVYDFTTCEWSTLAAQMLCGRVGLAAAISPTGNSIFVIGGRPSEDGAPLRSMEIYDVDNHSWSSGHRMRTGRTGLGVAISPDGNRLFAVGGAVDGEGQKALSSVEYYRLAANKTIARHLSM
eukprot:CAMPEP_0184483092 /NCGR_PEP_ID=MMETSP0113_2-20130426/4714_1 /TAXON_ID=91329 /ORGANISM="Norrisiella sphaerica, Strain BC52" /LENGTH=564 /DNA_ID=CAMNT_0026863265 /DNA_START=465 /DNA_END=2159 /DNA_ORIENTATION=-